MMRCAVCAVLLVAGSASAQGFLTPTEPDFAWTRGVSEGSAYAEWTSFTNTIGLNVPQAVFAGSPLDPAGPDWDAYDTTDNSFITGTGNIYAIFTPLLVNVDVPGFGLGEGFETTVLLQVTTQGTEIDPASVLIRPDPFSDAIFPVETQELRRVFLGEPMVGGGGSIVDVFYRFTVPGSTAGFRIAFDAAEGSMSLDRIAVDIFSAAAGPAACNLADVSPVGAPDGVLNVNDVIEFVNAFTAGGVLADVSPVGAPDGVINVNDIIEFVNNFSAGCP